MAQDNDAIAEAQTETIDKHDANGRRDAGEALRFTVGDDTLTLVRATRDPRRSPTEIECKIAEKAINQYTLVETSGRSRSGTASSINHQDRLLFVARDDDKWTCYNPQAGPVPRRDNSDYLPTQVPGVSYNSLFRRHGGRGSESRYKNRYKVERELVRSFDEVWMVEYRSEQGGSRNGSYSRIKNATATKLTADE